MHEELIKALRTCADNGKVCEDCIYYLPCAKNEDHFSVIEKAADAIEELWKKYLASEVDNTNLTGWLAEEHAKHLWIPVTERLPDEGQEILVAGEMKYEWETSLERFVDIGMLQDMKAYYPDMPTDVLKWSTINDWYEGQETYRITHWMPLPEPPTIIEAENSDE